MVFRRLPPGDYSVSASVVFAGGALKRNSTSVKVLPGRLAKTTVRVSSPPPVPVRPPSPPQAHRSRKSLVQEIDKLEDELKSVNEHLGRIEGLDEIEDKATQGKAKLRSGDQEAVDKLARMALKRGRSGRVEKARTSRHALEEKLETLNKAYNYRWENDLD